MVRAMSRGSSGIIMKKGATVCEVCDWGKVLEGTRQCSTNGMGVQNPGK